MRLYRDVWIKKNDISNGKMHEDVCAKHANRHMMTQINAKKWTLLDHNRERL